jgi:preprotein translocase SecE subunit
VARQTRAQRRARRAEEGPGDAGVAQRGRARPATARPAQEPLRSEPVERRIPGSGARRFIGESWAELKKVEWPGQNQLIQGVTVVLIACVIVGIYLYAADQVFRRLVQDVLLR